MKHISSLFSLLFLCVSLWTHRALPASFYSEGPHYIHKRPTTVITSHYMSGATSLLGIIPALFCAAQWCYKWCKPDTNAMLEYACRPPQANQSEYAPLAGERPARRKAEIALYEGMNEVTIQSYQLDRTTRSFLHVHNLDDRHYTRCTGNVLQHALHEECVLLAQHAAHLKCADTINAYRPILAQAIDAGRACTHENNITHAINTIDWAHSLYRYLEAVISGIGEGIEETVSTFVHPYGTCKQLALSSHELVRCTLRMFHELGLIETLIDSDNDQDIQAYVDDRGRMLDAMAVTIKNGITSLTGPQASQKIAATATQAVLTGKCLGVLLSFFTHAAHQAPHIIDRASKAIASEEYALVVADRGAVHIAQEAAQLSFFASEKQLTGGKLLGLAGAYKPLADEIDQLRKIFEEYLLDKDKTLIHIFEGESNKRGKLGGLHHDYLGYLEAQGRIRILETLPNGMYRAEVLFNGKWEQKSFFPKHWAREKVLREITKLYERNKHTYHAHGLPRIEIEDIIAEVKVRIIVTSEGKIVTAYPVLRSS